MQELHSTTRLAVLKPRTMNLGFGRYMIIILPNLSLKVHLKCSFDLNTFNCAALWVKTAFIVTGIFIDQILILNQYKVSHKDTMFLRWSSAAAETRSVMA